MKKINLLFLVWICTFSAFPMRYLVQLGTEGAATWRTPGENEAIVDLATQGKSLDEWFNATVDTLDEVWVTKGTYVFGSNIIVNKAEYSVYGGFVGSESGINQRVKDSSGKPWGFANSTVLDGNNATSLIKVSDLYNNVLFDGFTITNGFSSTNGGGIGLRGGTTVQNCIISNNKATTTGGGVMLWIGGVVKDCLIENNSALSSGGGVFSQNTTAGPYNPLIIGCTIRYNLVKGPSTQGGGGMLVGGNGLPTKVINTLIIGNRAEKDDGTLVSGSALYTNSANNLFINCVIANNTGRIAIYFNGGEIVNSTIANNYSEIGYNVYFTGANSMKLINSIVWDKDAMTPNVAGVLGKQIVVSNCGMFPMIKEYPIGEDPRTTSNNFALEHGNDSQEGNKGPGFINPTTFTGIPTTEAQISEFENVNWDIKSTSGAIDKGTSHPEATFDMAGRIRPIGSAFDIGAYEYDPLLSNNKANLSDLNYNISVNGNQIIISGVKANQNIYLYSINGIKIIETKTISSTQLIEVPHQGIYILKIDNAACKLIIK